MTFDAGGLVGPFRSPPHAQAKASAARRPTRNDRCIRLMRLPPSGVRELRRLNVLLLTSRNQLPTTRYIMANIQSTKPIHVLDLTNDLRVTATLDADPRGSQNGF